MDVFCFGCFLLVFLTTFIAVLGGALQLAIFVRVVLSWVQLPLPVSVQQWIFGVTEPVLAPIRRALPGGGMGLDFSPFIAIIVINLLQDVLLLVISGT